ncbi:MAG TPA: response regulator transcription factor [Gemmatimonadales bacterium]|jgi:DNA-binding response OmpR family regulator|nr:response regulator transcription factor [Gemmatimonadales bacterium]
MARVLIVEDNRNLAHGLRTNLEYEGHAADVADDGDAGLTLARGRRHDLILLDLMLPGLDGMRLLETLRAEGIDTPVLVLTARGDEADKVRGLRNGADDYVTKPFALRELLARVGALLRRAPGASSRLAFGAVQVDPATRGVTRAGQAVPLRPKEYELLRALLRRDGRVATRAELLREVWGYQDSVISRTLDTHVGELRRKLEEDPARPRHILTVRKTGYRLAT